MTRAALLAAAVLAACDERGKAPADGPFVPGDAPLVPDGREVDAFGTVGNPGFVAPAAAVAAWSETSPGTFEPATLDLSCLDLPRLDPATTTPTTVSVTVRDFQSTNTAPGATVAAFTSAGTLTTATANGSGVATLTIPAGTKRFGYRVDEASSRPTFSHDQLLAATMPAQATSVQVLSNATAQTLPALIGAMTTPTRSILLGTMTDCQGHTLSNAIATVSGTTGMAMHLPGIDTFYFSDSVGLPVRHNQAAATARDGKFMVIELPATPTAVIQVWGFPSPADLAGFQLRLIGELVVPVQAGTALITRHDPHATR